jgi:hypothetical protein
MLLTKTVKVLVVAGTIHYYRSKGVLCNVGDKIDCPVELLKKNSHSKIEYQCDECGVIKETPYSVFNRSNGCYCHKCQSQISGEERVDESIIGQRFNRLVVLEKSHRKNSRWYWLCQCDCGNQTSVSSKDLKNGNVGSCKCLQRERKIAAVIKFSKERIGTKHHRWNHNLTPEERSLRKRQTSIIKKISRACFERDKFKCCICESNKKIHAHHLNSWKHFPDDRFDITNLITLCDVCHKKYHKIVKLKDVTKENFNIYLNNIKE